MIQKKDLFLNFGDGIKAFLNTDRYKGKDLAYLSKQMVNLARTNKLNGKETKISWSVKGEKNYIDLINKLNLKLNYRDKYFSGR